MLPGNVIGVCEMAKRPAMTTAERQVAYRQRHVKADSATDARLSMVVSLNTTKGLERLARHEGRTQRATLEALVSAAQSVLLEGMSSAQQDYYYRDDDVTR